VSTLALDSRPALSRTQVIAATTIGTALEFYDFTIYSYFAIQIGQLFFPSASPVNQFLLSIGVFGVGFVVRPLGGVVIGAYADRAGRKKAMVLTIMMMALSCALIATAPTYAVAGIFAPMIVLAARLMQGFAAGGEFGPGTTLLVEYASDRTRAFFASWNFAATALGLALGAAVATLINVTLSKEAVLAWGWRLPFLLGIFAAFFLPSHAVRTLHLSPTAAVVSGVVSSLVLFVVAPIAGRLADRYSRKRVLVTSRIIMLLAVTPAFAFLGAHPTPLALYAVSALLAVFVAAQIVPVLVMIPELFPKHVRATGIALTYVVSASFFGGFSPFIASWLVERSGNPLAPAWYVAAACLVSLVPVIWLKDRTGQAL
jgi:MHS family proline/betaine transporter-like MFS transporter